MQDPARAWFHRWLRRLNITGDLIQKNPKIIERVDVCLRKGEPMRYKITRIESVAETWLSVTGTNNLGTVTVHAPASDAANYFVDGHFWIRADAEGE